MRYGKHRKPAFKPGDHVQWAGLRYVLQCDVDSAFTWGPFEIVRVIRTEFPAEPGYLLKQINPEGPEFECFVKDAFELVGLESM
jgi:hypothetical protein